MDSTFWCRDPLVKRRVRHKLYHFPLTALLVLTVDAANCKHILTRDRALIAPYQIMQASTAGTRRQTQASW